MVRVVQTAHSMQKSKHDRDSSTRHVIHDSTGKEERIALDAMRRTWDRRGRDTFLLLQTARTWGMFYSSYSNYTIQLAPIHHQPVGDAEPLLCVPKPMVLLLDRAGKVSGKPSPTCEMK